MIQASAYAAFDKASPLAPFNLDRRDPLAQDVAIDVLFCGVCHSDLHTARAEWEGTIYPCVPGHEIVGRVSAVGAEVRGFKTGDIVGVGCMVDSCRTCASCRAGEQQYCDNGDTTFTYNSVDKHQTAPVTYGGYSSRVVVDQAFCLRLPPHLDPAAAAPLLCAGITTYSPLKHWGAGAGKKIGVVGLGGLGHMGVKFAHTFGAHTVLFTTSAGKTEDAKRLGADEVVISRDAEAMAKHVASFDIILNTVAASHDLDAYTALLARDGTMVLVGVPELPHPSPAVGPLIIKRRSIAGSLIGGIPETQEMLDFCGAHNIVSEIEVIPIQKVNEAYDRMLRGDVKYRFVIDCASLGQ
ncbi:MAG TPA: NAD(P)-dependent alcohol dehydrogenase [Vicinamibacterales bacterium]|nr:NAD(P)-dependent alcohol dehydrogenase [Vicinamibacterales bacterium]